MVDLRRKPRMPEGMLRAFIEESIKLGRSANESLRKLNELGYGMRRQEFLNWFRDIANLPAKKDAFKSLPNTKVFSSRNYTINENRISGFRTVFKIRATRADGVSGEKIITISHNKPLTKSEFIKRVKEMAKEIYINDEGYVFTNNDEIKEGSRAVDAVILEFQGGTKGWLED
jgi:hypothetical protein